MSNSDTPELKQSHKVTLYVDCGGHTEEIPLDHYPLEYDIQDSEQRCGIPTPKAIRIEMSDDGTCGYHTNLYSDEYVEQCYNALEQRVIKTLNAALVNEKQKQAVIDIIDDYFLDFKQELWRTV